MIGLVTNHTYLDKLKPMHIGLALYPGCIPSGLFAFAELLEIANIRSGEHRFSISWAGVDSQPVPISMTEPSNNTATTPLQIIPDRHLTDSALDAILLPGMWIKSLSALQNALTSHQAIIDALGNLSQNTHIYSYCTAVSLVAKAGQLQACEATSTWWLADYFKSIFKGVEWRFSRTCIFTNTHATASGINGYLPIALELIEKQCGPLVLSDITKLMMLPQPKTDQPQFQAVELMMQNDPLIRKIYLWVEKTSAAKISTSALANFLHSSERTVARKIKAATGKTSRQFMQLIKLNQASENLILTSTPINLISEQLGYLDDTSFRRSFKTVTGYTPSEYRQKHRRTDQKR